MGIQESFAGNAENSGIDLSFRARCECGQRETLSGVK
jgi:hypothetical protein